MNVKEEKEKVISSDEYSDADDDDDAFMNDAIRPQNQDIISSDCSTQDKKLNSTTKQKQKELSSLIRRNKISIIYKNKSIKWLNNKRERDRYKKRINQNSRNFNIAQVECITVDSLRENQLLSDDKNNDAFNIQHIINVQRKDPNFKSNKENKKVNYIHHSDLSGLINHNNKDIIIQPENVHKNENLEDIQKIKGTAEKVENQRKRSTSGSSSLSDKGKEFPQFDSGINNLFLKFDKIASNHIDYITNSCLKSLDEKMENLSTEIDILNEVINSKENELNRLSYLKMVKEEIYFRLNGKRHILQKKESFSNKQQYTLLELKELEICLSDKKKSYSESYSADSIQKLMENRANMSTKDLEHEQNNTSRLHSLLVSQNILHATELIDNTCFARNVKKINIGLKNMNFEKNNDLDEGKLINTEGRKEEVRNVNSLSPDFKVRNSEFLPRIERRIKSIEFNTQQEKISELLHKHKFKFLPNSVNEISITPIGLKKKMSSCLESVRSEGNLNKIKGSLNGKCSRSTQYPFCQECKTKESRFVCAGCGNQWYCSKNCQIMAWDTHSDQCTE